MARWRSRRESFMWSARRKSWGGFVVDMVDVVVSVMLSEGGFGGEVEGYAASEPDAAR
jgi:hypothetical protein